MREFGWWWESGGAWMVPILGIGVVGLVVALSAIILSLVMRHVRGLPLICATVVLGFGVLAVVVGLAGRERHLQRLEEAIAKVHPDDREIILLEGGAEARTPATFGLLMGAGPLFLGISMLGWGLHRVRIAPNNR